ncbi:MAG: ribosomal protein S18 acetylase RimI-like enzyme [Kiritimatiellia bacterium]|jgi:ribosomal protein S18 acetylase RimI-like enzyme
MLADTHHEASGYVLRCLQPRHARVYRTLRHLALGEAAPAFGSSLEEELEKSYRQYLNDLTQYRRSTSDFLLGLFQESDDQLIGCIGFYRQKKLKTRHKGLIWGMYVHRDFRRKGLARWMLNDTLQRIRQLEGLEMVHLCVANQNTAAMQLYKDAGFKTFGSEPKAFKLEDVYYNIQHMYLEV